MRTQEFLCRGARTRWFTHNTWIYFRVERDSWLVWDRMLDRTLEGQWEGKKLTLSPVLNLVFLAVFLSLEVLPYVSIFGLVLGWKVQNNPLWFCSEMSKMRFIWLQSVWSTWIKNKWIYCRAVGPAALTIPLWASMLSPSCVSDSLCSCSLHQLAFFY